MKALLVKILLAVNTITALPNPYSYRDDIYMMTSEHGSRVWIQTQGTADLFDDTIFDFDDSFELERMEYGNGAYNLYGYGFHFMMYGWNTEALNDDIIADYESFTNVPFN